MKVPIYPSVRYHGGDRTPFPTKYEATTATAANSLYLETMLSASNCRDISVSSGRMLAGFDN